ncbi:891fd1c9-617d-4767-ab14-0078807203f2 [Thermothielavioides terrestris]|uniref:891fd1c9-617d-4767-ab14-0078807203f2 n=1 Tax=Thermothielavioides terrestris TaxID=2587410 RepID=A0A446BUN5_9PEZI|nr:891fd1c9-617d-4767-ab14-0078807203f2 [Thermothielavioides terrestris]
MAALPSAEHPPALADPEPAPSPDADAILAVATYSRADFELPVVSVYPSQHDAVRSSVFQTFGRAQAQAQQAQVPDVGRLRCLPFEIVSLICLSLDVSTAFRFSHVSCTAREVLASIREFRQLRAHALECLCVLLRSGLAAHIGVSALYAALTTQNCSLCGSFGGFFFMPTATRCCLACVASAPTMRVGYLTRLADAVGVPAGELEGQLPVLRTLPASRRSVVTVRHALGSLREKGVGAGEAQAAASRWPDSLTLRFQAATSLPWVDRVTGAAEASVSCKGCQLAFESDYSDDHLERRDRFYSRSGFVKHFAECGPAAKLWVSSREGTAPVEEPRWVGLGRMSTAPCGARWR